MSVGLRFCEARETSGRRAHAREALHAEASAAEREKGDGVHRRAWTMHARRPHAVRRGAARVGGALEGRERACLRLEPRLHRLGLAWQGERRRHKVEIGRQLFLDAVEVLGEQILLGELRHAREVISLLVLVEPCDRVEGHVRVVPEQIVLFAIVDRAPPAEATGGLSHHIVLARDQRDDDAPPIFLLRTPPLLAVPRRRGRGSVVVAVRLARHTLVKRSIVVERERGVVAAAREEGGTR